VTPLRIGITCYPTFGGSGIIATEIGLSLARRGHAVHFICYDVPRRLERPEANVTFHRVEVRDYPLFQYSSYPLALASKMVEVATQQKLDLLHVHYAIPHAASAYMARQILGPGAPKIVTTLHGTDITLVGNERAFLPITRFSIVESDAITVPSRYLAEATYANLDIPRAVPIEVIPNFVDSEKFRPAPLQKVAPILIHNSNFRPLKRVDDVIRIFAIVKRARSDARLVLVGDGPEHARVEAMVREAGLTDAVTFLGEQLSFVESLQQGAAFLLPSESESFGLAALEALACGVPVVASSIGGLPELITEGETGFLRPLGDIEAMAQAALSLLSDEDLRARMAVTARQSVEAKWRREPAVDRYESCYRRVLGAS
jgi:N-acetyl-alpha-D-glucosaminyl L-malate synthase BshA